MEKATTNKRRRIRAVDRSFKKAFGSYRPPEKLTVSQWAAKHRILSRESSAEAGPWRNERTPYLVQPMDDFTDPRIRRVTMVASSQVGKSEFELNCIGYVIHQDPGSMLYIQPSIDDAKKFSKLRIAPRIRDSVALRSKVADVKGWDSGNTVLQKFFPGGMLTMVGSNSASALASTPARYILGDERDRWALSAGTEGDPWALAEARTTTYYNAKLVDVSTCTIKGASPIAAAYEQGTQERWKHQCPHCEEWHEIDFDNIKFEFDTFKAGKKEDYIVKTIEWSCPGCGCLSSEDTMRLQPAKWIPDNPAALEKGHRSFWLNGFASPWQSWQKIIYAFLAARKDPQKLQVVYNTMFGKLWEDRGDLEDEDTYLSRREDYGIRDDGSPVELPDGVLVLTCGVDTQDDRLEYEVVGWSHYYENWGIKKGVIMGDPNDDAVWNRLDDVVSRVYRFANGQGLTISMTFVDSGGHKTQSVYRHCRDRLQKRVFAIKGQGGDGVPFTKPPSKVKIVVNGKSIGQTWLYSLGVDAGKADVFGSLKVQEPVPKYCHFPKGAERGYDLAFFNGLLLLANYKDKRIMFDGVVETVPRGSFITSMVKLSERWRMNRKTVKRFLDILQEDGMITYECTRRRTSITVVNYDLFQSVSGSGPDTSESNERGTTDGTSETIENTGLAGFDFPSDGQLNEQGNGQAHGHQRYNSPDSNGTTLRTQHKKVKNIKESQESKESKRGKTSSLEASQNLFNKLIPDYTLPENLKAKMAEWIIYKAERRETYKEQGMKALLRKIENNSKEYGAQAVCDLIDECMASNWSGIIFDKLKTKQGGNTNGDATNKGDSGSTRRYGNYI